ncbi:NeuD/PglB/VioB family sugar acetyltransferase [Nocardioides zeicaulis]|uniref:NeuD/PglB/VioB family sugar acetyltransferase n=1 Tax=Nocardioides zeicaulis TaxID=1776857 RepID=A0ABV6DZI3_9ACTN
MGRLAVVGAGGFASEVLALVEASNAAAGSPVWQVVGVLADWVPDDDFLDSWDVAHLGATDAHTRLDADVSLVVAVGDPDARRALVARIGSGRDYATLVHPSAALGRHVRLGAGAVVCSHASLTTHVVVGRHAQVHAGAVVGHDCVLDDLATVSPGAIVSGGVHLEEASFLGAGAVVNPRVTVGRGAVVGSGAVVVSDVAAGTTAVGVPARPLAR